MQLPPQQQPQAAAQQSQHQVVFFPCTFTHAQHETGNEWSGRDPGGPEHPVNGQSSGAVGWCGGVGEDRQPCRVIHAGKNAQSDEQQIHQTHTGGHGKADAGDCRSQQIQHQDAFLTEVVGQQTGKDRSDSVWQTQRKSQPPGLLDTQTEVC